MKQSFTKKRSSIKKQTQDALNFLISEHMQVRNMFLQLESFNGSSPAAKKEIVDSIYYLLNALSQIKQEIFYPRVVEAIDEENFMYEVKMDIASEKILIEEIRAMNVDDHLYDEKVKILFQHIDQHLHEERSKLFPKIRQANIDLFELGEEMSERREKIEAGFLRKNLPAYSA